MSDVAIRVENLGKRYRIGSQKEQYGMLRDIVMGAAKAPLRALQRGDRPPAEEFWALRDVSFELKQGEILGVIGRNGAGKSTLLKILSRITEPTAGRATIRGRVGSLLEVGTGFHPELTGRENIYLNGAIIGMSRQDIDRRFDEIVEFAGVERFLDTPVKRYSSGMYTRLAFSVAAHLEPEVLIVDEVLSVGDASFQKKSIGKMGDVARDGRSVLFVSHNMAAVLALCSDAILLEHGNVLDQGNPSAIVSRYYGSPADKGRALLPSPDPERTRPAYIRSVALFNDSGSIAESFRMGEAITAEMEFVTPERLDDPSFGFTITGLMGEKILRLVSRETIGQMPPALGRGVVHIRISDLNLLPGTYGLTVGFSNKGIQLDLQDNALQFEVTPWNVYSSGKVPLNGVIFAPCEWTPMYNSVHSEQNMNRRCDLGDFSITLNSQVNRCTDWHEREGA